MQFWFVTVPKYLRFTTFSKDLLEVSKLWFCLAFWWWDIIIWYAWSLCLHLDQPLSLPLTEHLCLVYVLYVFTQRVVIVVVIIIIIIISIDQGLMWSIQFQTFLIAYSKAKLKSTGDEAFPCSRSFRIGNVSDWFQLLGTLLWVSFKHTLISLNSFIVIPNSVRMLCNSSVLHEAYAFLKSIDKWCTVLLYSIIFLVSGECGISD